MQNIVVLAKYALLLFVNMKKLCLGGHCNSVISFSQNISILQSYFLTQ